MPTARTKSTVKEGSKPAAKEPWKKKNPKPKAARTKMTQEQKDEARARAEKAGRPYPNLVDNMAVKKKAASEKKS